MPVAFAGMVAAILVLTMMSPPPGPPGPITKAQALAIARRAVSELSREHKFIVQENQTQERPFGWVFFYTTEEYAKTHDIKYAVPGTAPFVVLRSDGSVEHLGSSVPPARAVEIFEQHWRETHPANPSTK